MEEKLLTLLNEIYKDYKDTKEELIKAQEALNERDFEAKKKFNIALCKVQAELRSAKESKKNSHFRSNYATLQDYIREAQPILTKHGFSINQDHEISPNGKTVLVSKLKHVDGHEEPSRVLLNTKDDTNPQQRMSYNTYMRRMTMASQANISSGDDDDDGEMAMDRQGISAKQYTQLLEELDKRKDKNTKISRILNRCKINSLDEIPISKFQGILQFVQDDTKEAR